MCIRDRTGWCPFDHPANGKSTPVLDFGAIEGFLMGVIEGKQEVIKEMLEANTVDVNIVVGPQMRKALSPQCAKQVMGKAAVTLAAWHGHLEVLQFLLASGGATSKCEDETMSPQFAAVSGAQVFQRSTEDLRAILEALYAAGADVNEEDEDSEQNVLHQAIDKKQWGIVPFLIEKGAYLNDKDFNGFAPIAKAAGSEHVPTVQLLLESKATPKVHSEAGMSPLATACRKNAAEIAELLLKHGAIIDAEAYYAALGHPEPAVLQLLQKNGGFPGSRNADGSIALHCAACDNNIEVANTLAASHKARTDAMSESFHATTGDSGLTPLMLCSRHGSIGVAQVLLAHGADINFTDKDGNTALHHTWWETKGRIIHNARMYDFLCTVEGVNKDAKNNNGYKPEMPDDESECVIS
eukprot:TRINITY_DN11790_c0_g1_i4.p1 TRINITY_DN11790_c0_g1~~TRINITY_DN11790_c0_g1_i4.p1  ORF type:complete len:410 (-),score=130.38 TRINITY_DN11790_c0_g1_i4:243-1472(-)